MATPSNLQLERLLADLVKERERHAVAKERLKEFRIESEALTDLKRAARDIRDQVKAEKQRLEEEFKQDEDFQDSTKEELESRERMRELTHELRELLAEFPMKDDLASFEFNIQGDRQQIQLEKVLKMYINGKEQRE
ncbi:hypothetical protein COW46_01515 [Candidatus Gracilibacteria bacterium CG17_big_fil_post_rev_8_21_14_2_50_48_13]|nr:MAG: hypothetical protein COW46_01515 [Candidatus Gracilibacteria bacterium CG17_big_fil_post_rev_8_21_14_2_50_48_13]